MPTDRLTKDTIAQPGIWRLSLLAGSDAVDAVFFSPIEDHSLMYRRLPLEDSSIAALEEIVYDNPLLLADFQRVSVLVDTKRFMPMPSAIADSPLAAESLATLWPGQGQECIVDSIAGCDWSMAMSADSRLVSFLRRTFPNARICHRLSPLAAWLANKSMVGSNAKLYVHMRADGIDLLLFDHGKPYIINSFETTDTADMAYYALATLQSAGISAETAEIHLCGHTAHRDELSLALRRRAGYVMPVVFPSAMYKAGKEALDAPFELIVLPLCE